MGCESSSSATTPTHRSLRQSVGDDSSRGSEIDDPGLVKKATGPLKIRRLSHHAPPATQSQYCIDLDKTMAERDNAIIQARERERREELEKVAAAERAVQEARQQEAIERAGKEAARRVAEDKVAAEYREQAEEIARQAATIQGQAQAQQERDALKSDLIKIAEIEVRNKLEKEYKDKSSELESSKCVICLDATKTIVLMPCKHMVMCEECGMDSSIKTCPMCRKPIQKRFHVYS